jgi:hypothetical protein
MTSDWADGFSRLNQFKIFDYFKKRGMPEFVEPLVTELVSSFGTYSDLEQRTILSAVTPEISSVLGWYARKMAGRAVRESSRTDLWNGLVAALIFAGVDFRDEMPALALLSNSAVRLGENPGHLLETVAKISPAAQSGRKLFEMFLKRPDELKSIHTFGFSEGQGPHGFDYIPLLPEYGGPTPLEG